MALHLELSGQKLTGSCHIYLVSGPNASPNVTVSSVYKGFELQLYLSRRLSDDVWKGSGPESPGAPVGLDSGECASGVMRIWATRRRLDMHQCRPCRVCTLSG